MPPLLSAAMIVRNEEDMLPECLEALRSFVDEICIVDTGSEDGTLEIARRFGCRIGQFPWNDDFSAARNASLELCAGNWVFVVDADERIAPNDQAALRALMDTGIETCYRLVTRNYTNARNLSEFQPSIPGDPNARGFAGWFPSVKVRLFPNGTGAKFEGHVHELVNPSLEARGIAIHDCAIPIHHYPLLKSEAALRRKQALYIELGIKKTELTPEDPKVWAELGAQLLDIADYPRAVRAYKEAVRRAPNSPALLKELGNALYLFGRPAEAAAFFEASLKLDAAQFDTWRNLGVVHANQGQWEIALDHFDRAIALRADNADLHRYRGLALAHLGRHEEAAQAAREALCRLPESMECRALYEEQMTHVGRTAEARELLEKLSG
jgi:glycosyltransferase involved in cell wall biosynthesis